MRVLIACEYSGVTRRAFATLGHDAWSCDLLPSEDDSPNHLQCDAQTVLADGWDLMIGHPPCTLLTRAGARWWKGREDEQDASLAFVRALLNAPIPRIAIENPPGAIGTRIRPANQYIQPWEHGHPEKKLTGLWLVGLPLLRPSKDVSAEMAALPRKEQERVLFTRPGPDRWKARSRSYEGIAAAMAEQWGARLQPGFPVESPGHGLGNPPLQRRGC